ncbi:hypothetical protein NG895_28970 [Aeoliella sp. ICT_H6.2]|uniref:Uncharacterized protein n=1 Tax=Aeoliella straminimaris TaxID=2954799 RepID=A0A9X2FFA2_9BACT|nr:hypothetical protein [Aeoliella straminimaris]MCO6047955.1 hypothetical protein [Aeoliella straminimaris]
MGGIGSGTWYRFEKKHTVEQSLALCVGDFRGRMCHGASGSFTWTRYGGWESSIGYYVASSNGIAGVGPTITLHYRRNDTESIEIPIQMQSTPANFGGVRWWFTCPLMVGDTPCQRRVGKLYLPNGARYFGCRHCHRLTYRSCQEAHQRERMMAFLDCIGDWQDGLRELLGEWMTHWKVAPLALPSTWNSVQTTCFVDTI